MGRHQEGAPRPGPSLMCVPAAQAAPPAPDHLLTRSLGLGPEGLDRVAQVEFWNDIRRGLEMPASESLGGQGRAGARLAQSTRLPRPRGHITHSAASTSSRPCGGTGGGSRRRRPPPAAPAGRGARGLQHRGGPALSAQSPLPRLSQGPCCPTWDSPAVSTGLPGLKPDTVPGPALTHLPALTCSRKPARVDS